MTTDVRVPRTLQVFVAIMAVTAVVAVVGIFVDPRVLTGVPIWEKPFKFALSIALYLGTLGWMLSVLPRRSKLADRSAIVVTAALAAEMIIIVGQVIRGQNSHFNDTTPFNAALWNAMAISIGVLFVAHLVIATVALRQRIQDRVAAYAVRLGLLLAVLGMLAAVPMVVLPGQTPDDVSGAHSVGVPDGGPGLPVLGWSTVAGDLRIGHFVGLHGLQAMPLLALLLSRFAGRLTVRAKVRLLVVAAVAYALLTASFTIQALRAQSVIHPDVWTLAGWATIALGAAAAGALVVARDRADARGFTLAA